MGAALAHALQLTMYVLGAPEMAPFLAMMSAFGKAFLSQSTSKVLITHAWEG